MRRILISLLIAVLVLSLFSLFQFANPFVIKDNPAVPIISERVNSSNVEIGPDGIKISIDNISISRYANTTSMLPLISESAKGITIKPKSPSEINEGDIITYERGNELIVHRVVAVGYDDIGWYAVAKGDNTVQEDGKVRFGQIKSILIGILY